MIKKVLTGSVLVSLMGCVTSPVQIDPTCQNAVQAVQAICTGQVVPSTGETNESLLQGFLVARAGLQVCQAILVDLPC